MSDIEGGVLLNRKFHYAPATGSGVAETLAELKASKRTARHRPAILIATDGESVAAEQWKTGERLHCSFSEISDHFGFFLPAAGKERYRPAEENPIDVKATGKLAKLYDALIKANPDWASEARRHDISQFMTRLIFCMFAEDVGIFPEHQFSQAIFTHSGDRGEEAHAVLASAFQAMDLPDGSRAHLPSWTHKLEYVNGGLFAGTIDAPTFNLIAFRYLRDACDLDWREINPDIFGSMIQSVADPEARAELGMHYTSVPNIMKVLGPLFLDELDADIEKAWDRPNGLRRVLQRMSAIRVFDPACGSGNFLVVAYRQLRTREIRILTRLGELEGDIQIEMWSCIPISNFYGIEITDFAAETAKLAMFIAEYQANSSFSEVFGRRAPDLPLRDGAKIVCANALRQDWSEVCSHQEGGETMIASNPPFVGTGNQTDDQKADRNSVFDADRCKGYKCLDLVAAWFYLAAKYRRASSNCRFAFVATSSITQGRQVPALWPHLLIDHEIFFAHRPFKWRNNAAANAAVDCIIAGVSKSSMHQARLFEDENVSCVSRINAYLIPGPILYVKQKNNSLFGLPQMVYGSMPNDGGGLILSFEERNEIIARDGRAERFIRPLLGTTEIVEGTTRYCLWIEDEDLVEAKAIKDIAARIELTRNHRQNSKNDETKDRAKDAHRFWHIGSTSQSHSLLIASASSERRDILPSDRFPADVVASNLCFVIHDAPDWCFALLSSHLHKMWITTVCGKLERRYRYSNSLGWHTFPAPSFTNKELDLLTKSARAIMKIRYRHHPCTIAELYDPDRMPDDLRAAHATNDRLVEEAYVGRRFRTDTERLEHLFKLYAARVKKVKKEAA